MRFTDHRIILAGHDYTTHFFSSCVQYDHVYTYMKIKKHNYKKISNACRLGLLTKEQRS